MRDGQGLGDVFRSTVPSLRLEPGFFIVISFFFAKLHLKDNGFILIR